MTSQQDVGNAVRAGVAAPRAVSYLNHENVLGAFDYEMPRTKADFQPTFELVTVPHAQIGLPEHWLTVRFASKLDGDGMREYGRPPLSLCLIIDISGSMMRPLEGDVDAGTTTTIAIIIASIVVPVLSLLYLYPPDCLTRCLAYLSSLMPSSNTLVTTAALAKEFRLQLRIGSGRTGHSENLLFRAWLSFLPRSTPSKTNRPGLIL